MIISEPSGIAAITASVVMAMTGIPSLRASA
jgi:hypothetical protein